MALLGNRLFKNGLAYLDKVTFVHCLNSTMLINEDKWVLVKFISNTLQRRAPSMIALAATKHYFVARHQRALFRLFSVISNLNTILQ